MKKDLPEKYRKQIDELNKWRENEEDKIRAKYCKPDTLDGCNLQIKELDEEWLRRGGEIMRAAEEEMKKGNRDE